MISWKGSVPLPPLEYISSWITIQLINLPDTTYPLGYKNCVFYYYFALKWIYAYSIIRRIYKRSSCQQLHDPGITASSICTNAVTKILKIISHHFFKKFSMMLAKDVGKHFV